METFEEVMTSASVLIGSNNYQDAIEQFKEAVGKTEIPEQKIDIYNSIGRLCLALQKNQEAVDSFEKSLAIHDSLPEERATRLQVNKATILNNLGVITVKTNPKAAIKYHKRALAIFLKAHETNPADFGLHLANTHYSYADASYAKGDFYMAKKQYKDAIKAYDTLKNSEATDPVIANSHYNLGNIYTDEDNVYDARNHYVKALKIFRKLTETQPEAFRSLVAATFNNLAVTAKTMYQYGDAITYYEKSLAEYELLIKDDRSTFLPFYAATQNSIGIIYSEQHEVKDDYDSFGLTGFSGFGTLSTDNSIDNKEKKGGLEQFRKKKSLKHYLEAVKSYQELMVNEPELYSHYLATAYHNLGVLFDSKSDFKEAEEYFEKALTIRRDLAKQQPQAFNLDVCVTLLNVVTMYQNLLEQTVDIGFKTASLKILEEIELRMKMYADDERPILNSMRSDISYFKKYFSKINEEDLDVFDAIVKENAVIENINETPDPSEKLKMQKHVVNLYYPLLIQFPNNLQLKKVTVDSYVKYTWFALRSDELGLAEKSISTAKQLDKDSLNLIANEALLFLLRGDAPKFKEIYASIKDKMNEENKAYSKVILEDLTVLKRDGFIKKYDIDELLS